MNTLGTATIVQADARALPLADASVDAIICDPPYGLEFMGKEWDAPWRTGDGFRRGRNGADAGRNDPFGRVSRTSPEYVAGVGFQQWCEQWAAEAVRVLRPGGHLIAFGGARTWHRLTCAIEDAGFEIRDSIAWLYGCLTADAEILTEHGWKPGIEVGVGERVAQWDSATGVISLALVQHVFRAPWDGPMRVFRNADTDQVLTPNHRVYHQPCQRRMDAGKRRRWYDDHWGVADAGELTTWNPIRLPLAGEHNGSGIGGEDYAALLGWVWTEGGFDLSGSGVRIYQSSVNTDKVAEIAALMDRLGPHKRYDQQRTYTRRNGAAHPHTATTWFFSGELANRVRADLPGKRPTYDLLWRMTGAEKRAMLRAAMLGDGSGWGTAGQQFYQQYEDDLVWLQTLLALIGKAGKVAMRPNRPGGAVYLRDCATTELQARHLRDAWQDYTGEVWCVSVPTGAFVARRKGKVFITGNSGFPKSLDVSKAIDAAAGVAREVVGTGSAGASSLERRRRVEMGYRPNLTEVTPEAYPITAPATDDAQRWAGWGTALKPGYEPIVVARKPLTGTVAGNVLTHGTGALNIDACRLSGMKDVPTSPRRAPQGHTYGDLSADPGTGSGWDPATGRWPTNVVLSHPPLLDEHGKPDGDACADACAPGCPVAELDGQSGTLTSGKLQTHHRRNAPRLGHGGTYGNDAGTSEWGASYGDRGGASRFFPTFRYEAKASTEERPVITLPPEPVLRLRDGLTDEQRGYVLAELRKAGVDAS